MPAIDPQRIQVPDSSRSDSERNVPIQGRLQHIASQIQNPQLVRSALRQIVREETGAILVAHVIPRAEGQWQLEAAQVTGELPQDEGLQEQLLELSRVAIERGQSQIQQAQTATALCLICVPITLLHAPSEVLLVIVHAPSGAMQTVPWVIELVVSSQKNWTLTHMVDRMGRQLDSANTLCELTHQVMGAEGLESAVSLLMNEVQRRFSCQRVAVGLVHGRMLRLAAVSGTTQVDHTVVPDSKLIQAMQETLVRQELSLWSSASNSMQLQAHRQLGKLISLPAIISSPLQLADGTVVGAWLWAGSIENLHAEETRRFMTAASPQIAIALQACRRAELGLIRKMGVKLRKVFSSRWGQLLLLGMTIGLGVLSIPVPSQVHCACRVLPVAPQYVVSPFKGQLDAVLVQRGDAVTMGQILARMGRHETPWMHRNRQREVVSPLSGVVLAAKRTRVDGTPVQAGEVLLEIAPLDRVRIEIEVPANEVSKVKFGQPVTLWLEKLSGESIQGTIEGVSPDSEVSEGRTVFLADLELPNSTGQMRPGMLGQAKIETPFRPLGAILLRPFWKWNLSSEGNPARLATTCPSARP